MLLILADIDECSLGGNVCHDGQDCENTIGSYRCVMRCGRGFRRTADGLSCTGTPPTNLLGGGPDNGNILTVAFFVTQM